MMRIICPVCGEEPQKGERHVCRAPPVAVPEQTELRRTTETAVAINVASSASGPSIGLQRRGLTATPGAVCASMASLVSKSPSLWKSGKALARSSGEEFVAGLLASAVGCGGWHKDAKRALVVALTGKVHGDAARALQDAWRKHAAARRPPPRVPAEKGPDGYLKLSLPRAAAGRDSRSQPQWLRPSRRVAALRVHRVRGHRPRSSAAGALRHCRLGPVRQR